MADKDKRGNSTLVVLLSEEELQGTARWSMLLLQREGIVLN